MSRHRVYLHLMTTLFSAALFFDSATAWASGGHNAGGHGDTAAHGDASPGLAQFDPSSFPSQIFWILLTFLVMLTFFSLKTLPDISGVLENRKQQIQGDMKTAEKLTQEADTVQKAYEEALTQARADASQVLQTLNDEIKAESAHEQELFRKRYEKKVATTEKNVEKAVQDAMSDMTDIAAELCTFAVEKISGIKTTTEAARAVIDSMNNTRKAA